MKRLWILFAGALPLALATPAIAGNGGGYNGPIIYRTNHSAGFIGAGHNSFSRRLHFGNVNGNFRQVRGRHLQRGQFRGRQHARLDSRRFFGHRNGRGHLLHRGNGFGHRNHDHSFWQRYDNRFPRHSRFNRFFRSDDKRSRHDNRKHDRRHARNGKQSDKHHKGDHDRHRGDHDGHDNKDNDSNHRHDRHRR